MSEATKMRIQIVAALATLAMLGWLLSQFLGSVPQQGCCA